MKIQLKNVRLAFAQLDKPKAFEAGQEARFSATSLFEPDSENHKLVLKAIEAVAKDKWGEKGPAAVAALTKVNKTCLQDGELKADKYDGFDGMLFVSANAKANSPPTLLDAQAQVLPRDTGVIYSGCMANVALEIWAQDNNFGKRINATLRGVQWAGKGEAFGGGAPAGADEFAPVEGIEATDSDFDVG